MRLSVLFLPLAALASACATSPSRPAPGATAVAPAERADATPAADVPRIAILSAFEPEWIALRAATQVTGTRTVLGRTHVLGRLGGQEVVLLLTGMSMVNAAMSAQAVIDRYRPTAILYVGVAGGVNPNLHVADVTVPAQWGQYQEHVFAREMPQGFAPARGAGALGHFGMLYPRAMPVIVPGGRADSLEERLWFDVDSAALATARRVAPTVPLARCTATGACLPHQPTMVVGGRGVSGPTFVDNAAYREWTWQTFRADALDMETAAVALVARQNGVPFLAFRALSDLAGGGAGPNESATWARLAADNAAAAAIAWLAAQPPRGR